MRRIIGVWAFIGMVWTLIGISTVLKAQTATVTTTLSWTAPTQNADSTAIKTPITYNVYQGSASGAFTKIANAVTALKWTGSSLTPGNCFAVTAVTADGESEPSQTVCIKEPNAPTSPAVQVTITIH
jgi:hypothetical protein